MKLKTAWLVVSSLTLFGTFWISSPLGAFAKTTTSEQIIFQKAPIIDINELFYRAEHGITDTKSTPPEIVAKIFNQNGQDISSKFNVRKLSTTQLIETAKKADGYIQNTYATTVFATSSIYEGTGNQSGGQWDPSYSVYAYATIYWDKLNVNGDEETQLTEVTGGWNIDDPSVAIINRTVNYGATGWTMDGGYVQQMSNGNHPWGNTFTYYPPSNWVPISYKSFMQFPRVFGVTTIATLSRSTETWSLQLTVNNN